MTEHQNGSIILDARGIRVSFRRPSGGMRTVVHDVDLPLRTGQVTVLLGESGSGKSVLGRSVIGMAPRGAHVTGQSMFDGLDLVSASPRRLRRLHGSSISVIAQDPTGALDPMRRVGAQLVEALRQHDRDIDRRDAAERGAELLRQVELRDVALVMRSYPHELSGGMRQRVAIALAICCEPQLIVADEPSSALDASVGARIIDLLAGLRETIGTAFLFITHDIGVAARMASHEDDSIAVMLAGRFMELGPAQAVWSDPAHPYTIALTGAEPSAAVPRGALPQVPEWVRDFDGWGPLEELAPGHFATEVRQQPAGAWSIR